MSTQTNTNKKPTFGKKLLVILIVIFFSFSFLHKPKAPQNEPITQAKQAILQDLSKNEIPFYQSEIYLKNQNNPNLQKKVDELLATSDNQKSISNSPVLEEKSIKKDLETKKLTFDDELGVFVNDQNKADLIAKTKEYIAKYSQNKVVLDAEMVVNFAKKKQFPLDLILVQAQVESNFCTAGRAIQSKQCWNIGAYDAGDTKPTSCVDGLTICQNSYLEGLELYQNFMVNCHFHEGEKPTLQRLVDRDFRQVRTGSGICGGIGKRYATASDYRSKIISILQTNFNPIFTK